MGIANYQLENDEMTLENFANNARKQKEAIEFSFSEQKNHQPMQNNTSSEQTQTVLGEYPHLLSLNIGQLLQKCAEAEQRVQLIEQEKQDLINRYRSLEEEASKFKDDYKRASDEREKTKGELASLTRERENTQQQFNQFRAKHTDCDQKISDQEEKLTYYEQSFEEERSKRVKLLKRLEEYIAKCLRDT